MITDGSERRKIISGVLKKHWKGETDFHVLREYATKNLDLRDNRTINALIEILPKEFIDVDDLAFQLLTTHIFAKYLAKSIKQDIEKGNIDSALSALNVLIELEVANKCF